jgi:hypothetical protein
MLFTDHYLVNHKIRNQYIYQKDMVAITDKKNEVDFYLQIENNSKEIM